MTGYVLRLFDDRLAPRTALAAPLNPHNRVVYVVSGLARLDGGGAAAALGADSAWFSRGPLTLASGAEGAHLLRTELLPLHQSDHGMAMGADVESELLLDAELDLEPGDGYLMRCDKVALPPGGTAYRHTHAGGGIRCLLEGGFTVETGGETRAIAPGEAWFERGPDPVLAWAPEDRPGVFSRVMVLPRALLGQSSIRYVDPADADKPKPQAYTVYIDRLIEV